MSAQNAPNDFKLDFNLEGLTAEEILSLLSGNVLFTLACAGSDFDAHQMTCLWEAYYNLEQFWSIVNSVGEGSKGH
jgi:hypothetical protein